MYQKPSLVLPQKRSRSSHLPVQALTVEAQNKNASITLPENELKRLQEYLIRTPGEFYKLDYWNTAIQNNLSAISHADSLKLLWRNEMEHDSLNADITITVNIESKDKINEQVQEIGNDFIISMEQGTRKIFNKQILQEKAIAHNITGKFEELLQKCRKISKSEVSASDLIKLLVEFKGKSKDVLMYFISPDSKNQIASIYEDCCTLSKKTIPYNKFVSLFIQHEGNINILYKFFKS